MKNLLYHWYEEKVPVEIIYLSKKGELSQRTIQIESFNGEIIKAYCTNKKALRMFKVENILSAQSKRLVH
ncbi:WYL domain-containing protein [Pseudalkalibacillus caeni]|uniref:WYL domain-containing protein n=1 Tax=Exobacillus caeni TaxID=2574798 RepID=A0A5R9FBG5_9BACL|nr:WYL domain-containing protein [Pseudalkalibacillus caeni]TLS39018.1 WYL domain-containing protein [Pseudalkalibacillus caeni]